jgi:hypothetical protein
VNGDLVVDPVIGFDELMDRYLELVSDPHKSVKLGVRYEQA